jgi:hypothetical protein
VTVARGSFGALAGQDAMSGDSLVHQRQAAAVLARKFRAGSVTYDEFMDAFYDAADPHIAELVDLLEHEPARGGLLGASERDWQEHQRQIEQAITVLEAETDGLGDR